MKRTKFLSILLTALLFIDPTRLRRLSDTNSYYSARRALWPILLCEACCPAWGGWRLLYELCIVRLIDRVKKKIQKRAVDAENIDTAVYQEQYILFTKKEAESSAFFLLARVPNAEGDEQPRYALFAPVASFGQAETGGGGKLGIFPLSSGEKYGNPDVPRAVRHPGGHGLSGGCGDRCVRGVLSGACGR